MKAVFEGIGEPNAAGVLPAGDLDDQVDVRSAGDAARVGGELDLRVEEALQVVARPFRIRLKGIGIFGGNKPHALYVGVAAEGEDLKRLQATHERICQMLGLPPEQRKFTPHMTIARLKDTRLDGLHHYIASHNLYESRPFEVSRFVLFSSRPSRGGGPYAIEEAYSLRAAV